jgi:hypothetical protein
MFLRLTTMCSFVKLFSLTLPQICTLLFISLHCRDERTQQQHGQEYPSLKNMSTD